MTRLPLAFALILLAGCPAPSPDECSAVIDAHCDGANDSALVGTWEMRVPGQTQVITSITFTSDSFSLESGGQVHIGTFRTAAGWLVREAEDATQAVPYQVIGQKLLLAVLQAEGPHDGAVGVWSGEQVLILPSEGRHVVATRIEILANGQATIEYKEDGQVSGTKTSAWRTDEHGRVLLEFGGAFELVGDVLALEVYVRK